jgi:hypothetical protein
VDGRGDVVAADRHAAGEQVPPTRLGDASDSSQTAEAWVTVTSLSTPSPARPWEGRCAYCRLGYISHS